MRTFRSGFAWTFGWWLRLYALMGLFSAQAPAFGAEATTVSEYQVKGAFLYQFAKFVAWPKEAFLAADTPIVIGIFGKDPFGPDLDIILKNRLANGRKVVVKRFADLASVKSCHILFVSAAEERRWPEIYETAKSLALLTVGETAQFTTSGGIVGLTLGGGTVHITINMDAAERARLVVSSHVHGVATIIRGGQVKPKR